MKTVTLFRTISADHISHRGYKWLEEEKRWIETGNPNDGFKWGGVGEWTEAPDWDDNPDIDDTNGLQAEGNGIWFGYLNLEDDILQIIKVPSDTLVISKDKRAWRFKRAFTKKEYKIEPTIDFWNILIQYKIELLIFQAGCEWNFITEQMKIDALFSIKNNYIKYLICLYWKLNKEENKKIIKSMKNIMYSDDLFTIIPKKAHVFQPWDEFGDIFY